MMENLSVPSNQLWPCPIPTSLGSSGKPKSGRRRARRSLRVVVREHLRVFDASCNWLCLGRPKVPHYPRQPVSAVQSRMLKDLEETIRLFYRLSPGLSSGLDRSFGKFQSGEFARRA